MDLKETKCGYNEHPMYLSVVFVVSHVIRSEVVNIPWNGVCPGSL